MTAEPSNERRTVDEAAPPAETTPNPEQREVAFVVKPHTTAPMIHGPVPPPFLRAGH